jgi:hypothetical protein
MRLKSMHRVVRLVTVANLLAISLAAAFSASRGPWLWASLLLAAASVTAVWHVTRRPGG